jgi:hypothetical protein
MSVREPVTASVTSVTASYSQLHEKCNQQNLDTEQDSAPLDSSVTSFLEKSTEKKQDVDNSIMFPPITEDLGEKQKSHTLIPEKNVTEENLEAEALTQTSTERLHIPCNQGVTGCNQEGKNVTEEVEEVVDTTRLVEQATREEWADESILNDMVKLLSACTTMQQLATLLRSWNQAGAIDKAYSQLSSEKLAQISEWQNQLNNHKASLKVGDRVYVTTRPHTDGCAPYLIQSIHGDYAKLEMFENPVLLVELRKP